MERLGCHWMGFYEIRYLRIFRISVEKIEVLLKHEKNDGTWRADGCMSVVILTVTDATWRADGCMSVVILTVTDASAKSCRENQNTHFMLNNFFPPKCCRGRQATDDNIIRRMRDAWLITKNTDTHTHTHTHTHKHTYKQTQTKTQKQTHTQTKNTHKHIHKQTHARTHAHTHTHTHTQNL